MNHKTGIADADKNGKWYVSCPDIQAVVGSCLHFSDHSEEIHSVSDGSEL